MKDEQQHLKSLSQIALIRYPNAEEFAIRKFSNHGDIFLLLNPVLLDRPTVGTVVSRTQVEEWANA